MRLAEFILDNIEPILKQWETFARTLTPAADGLDSVGLRDHAEQMLRTIAADLRRRRAMPRGFSRNWARPPPRKPTPTSARPPVSPFH